MPHYKIVQCPSCGASASVDESSDQAVICQFCGNAIPVSEIQPGSSPQELSPLEATSDSYKIPASQTAYRDQIPPQIRQLLEDGHKIEAIKIYRQLFGVGLKEAKDAVESLNIQPVLKEDKRPAREKDGQAEWSTYTSQSSQPLTPAKKTGWAGKIFLFLFGVGLFVFVLGMVFGVPFRMSGSYKQALAAAQNDPAVIEALGAPIKPSFLPISGELSCGSSSCSANYMVPIHGSRSSGRLFVFSNSRGGGFFKEGEWILNAHVEVKKGPTLELIPTPIPTSTLSPAQLDATEGAVMQATRRIEATQAVEATATSLDATATAQEEAADQALREAQETITIQATAESMQAAQASWRNTFMEAFQDNQNGWPVGTRQDEAISVIMEIKDGVYHWQVHPKHSNSYFNMVPATSPVVRDFYAAVDIRFVEVSLNADYAYGIAFRLVDNDYGFFGLHPDGHYRMLVVYDTGIYQLVVNNAPTMRIGLEETNHLSIRAIGNEFVFYINDTPVWRLTEDFAAGQVGLGVDVGEKSSDEQVEFSNFEIKTP